ncbi:MAG: NADH-quinone oxidoreductase subunit G, partial [Cellulomonadaceae bacterium]|nr:NADH-quinone oxidoreductase subunit G [Cellulomonadaceae bacterium]
DEIAGDPFIDLQQRGVRQQIGTFDPSVLGFAGASAVQTYQGVQPDGHPVKVALGLPAQDPAGPVGQATTDTSGRPFASYFSGNTVQICPVGALTGAAYRFRSRPFDLVSTPSIAEHDSNGAAIRIDHRRGVVLRRLAGDDPAVNEEWITDKDRFAFAWQGMPDRLVTPLVRDRAEDGTRGELRPASWVEALEVAATGLAAATKAGGVGVLPGGRVTLEDAWAYGKFARVVLGTNDVDHRARPHSAEEEAFLAHHVAGSVMGVTFADLESAPATLLVAFEPEDEGGIVYLRLRKGVQHKKTRVLSVAPFASRGLTRLGATLLSAAPGTEPEVLDAIVAGADGVHGEAAAALAGGIILVGERLATVPGGLSAVLRLAERTGARLAWIPRRAGERGGVEAGTLPNLLPGGRLLSDAAARVDMAAVWDVDRLPDAPGRDTAAILAGAADGTLGGLVVGGVDPADLPDPAAAIAAIDAAGFVVSLEVRASAVTALADVVLPVAPPVEKPGTFLTWEGRPRPFPQALTSTAMPDHRVLDALAAAMDVTLGTTTLAQVHAELDHLGRWDGARGGAPDVAYPEPPAVAPGQAVLATWHLLLDNGRLQDGEAFLAGTAQRPVVRTGAALAASLGLATGDGMTVSTASGQVTLPLVVTPMPDGVVWLPVSSPGSLVRRTLGVDAGAVVQVAAATRSVVEGESN